MLSIMDRLLEAIRAAVLWIRNLFRFSPTKVRSLRVSVPKNHQFSSSSMNRLFKAVLKVLREAVVWIRRLVAYDLLLPLLKLG
jgi:hypothetical protein